MKPIAIAIYNNMIFTVYDNCNITIDVACWDFKNFTHTIYVCRDMARVLGIDITDIIKHEILEYTEFISICRKIGLNPKKLSDEKFEDIKTRAHENVLRNSKNKKILILFIH